jgi:2',3'-cyclic-nucleotide 2'-phosphodiesterase (5'-nucleotidase family)
MVTNITIYHTADMHNRRSAFPLLRNCRKNGGALLLDSGDAIGGSNTLFYPAEPILAEMNEMEYAAMAMGNREFHYLRSVISMRARSVNFSLLAANIEDRTGRTSHCWKDYIVLLSGGLKIGVTGLSPVQFPEESFLSMLSGFSFIPPREALGRTMAKMKGEGVDFTILLSHLGIDDDRKIAESCSVDLVLGGHSHTLLKSPLSIAGTYIVHSGFFASHVGKVDLTFQEKVLASLAYEALPTGKNERGKRN